MSDLELELDDNLFEDGKSQEEINNDIVDSNDKDLFEDTQSVELNVSPIIGELLKERGIVDGKIKLIDEDNTEKDVLFSELTLEEQLEILRENNVSTDFGLSDSEKKFLEGLRKDKLSIEDFLTTYKESIIDSVKNQEVEAYDIDSYDDQELFIIDLKNKYDLTDEELAKELEKELKDETLFKKKVDALRKEYKKLEDQYNETQRLELEAKRQEEYDTFTQNMVNIAINTPEFYGIELEDSEKEEVLSFLLDLDEQGNTKFSKALGDPNKLYEAAWFLRYGKESFDALKNAYESEIAKLKKPDGAKVIRGINNHSTGNQNIHDLF